MFAESFFGNGSAADGDSGLSVCPASFNSSFISSVNLKVKNFDYTISFSD